MFWWYFKCVHLIRTVGERKPEASMRCVATSEPFLSKHREAGRVGVEAEEVLSTGVRGEGEFTMFPVTLGHHHLQTSHTPHRQRAFRDVLYYASLLLFSKVHEHGLHQHQARLARPTVG